MINYFQDETPDVLRDWDKKIHLESVPGELDWMRLTKPLPCGNGYIPKGFKYNGATVGPLRRIPILGFPKWKHPIATGRHDFRCGLANSYEKRLLADKLFFKDIGRYRTSNLSRIQKLILVGEQYRGYVGVRVGAYALGVKNYIKGIIS